MRTAILILTGLLAATPALADDKADALAVAKAYADAFNKADAAAEAALCTGQAAIIDDFPPHIWQGATACADWAAALAASAKEAGYSDLHVATAKPKALVATADRAYAVLPATYIYKNHGKPVKEPGLWTFALQKTGAGWRIAGWSWASE
jgi:hypothetical protein